MVKEPNYEREQSLFGNNNTFDELFDARQSQRSIAKSVAINKRSVKKQIVPSLQLHLMGSQIKASLIRQSRINNQMF